MIKSFFVSCQSQRVRPYLNQNLKRKEKQKMLKLNAFGLFVNDIEKEEG
jgi:hypothetical protein